MINLESSSKKSGAKNICWAPWSPWNQETTLEPSSLPIIKCPESSILKTDSQTAWNKM